MRFKKEIIDREVTCYDEGDYQKTFGLLQKGE